MGKVFGIGAVVLGIWFFSEVYTNGTANAFGGALSKLGLVDADDAEVAHSTPRARAGSAVSKAHSETDERRERLLGE
jgi:hypothetical protein